MSVQRWRKLGLVFCPSAAEPHPKLISHAANPLPVHIDGDVYRVFYSGRDVANRSSVGAVDIDVVKRTIVREHYRPFFEHGPARTFYADGVSIGNCYEVDGARYMLFMGWQNPLAGGHWRGDVGRLVVRSDLTLESNGDCPFLGIDATDPISISYPWVEKNSAGGWDIWYGSTITWDAGNGEMLHVIKHASSFDGHKWRRNGLAVPYEIGAAQAFSHPTVIGNANDGYRMWFSYRGGKATKYRIGYATSEDGDRWVLRLADAGIDISANGWDSEMIEYPFVFDHRGECYMLYNGNGYGKTGFGLAVLESY